MDNLNNYENFANVLTNKPISKKHFGAKLVSRLDG